MRLHSFRISNFRRLKDVLIEVDPKTSIFVGANNSGKTSATHILQYFFKKENFSIHDFSADCWATFDQIGSIAAPAETALPTIILDLWFEVQETDLHRVIQLLPSLDWNNVPIGMRMQFAPRDVKELLTNFHQAREKAENAAVRKVDDKGKADFHPWPKTLTEYLKKRLNAEYKIYYYVLDRGQCDEHFKENPNYVPQPIGGPAESGGNVIKSLLRVDFLSAQRHLSDSESKGRSEDLSKRLSRFYKHNLQKYDGDFDAVRALASSEEQLNAHLATVFKPTLENLNKLGYPGFADPHLVIKSAFNPESILTQNASVHYALRDPGTPVKTEQLLTLPDQYNGLGFKNLIYMVIEVLDFHQRWVDEEEDRPPLHLVIIEEPEAHLHAQLQQVFINKIMEILPSEAAFTSQLIVTTHSPHIIYESSFTPIRYFRRSSKTGTGNYSDVLNLSRFSSTEKGSHDFLLKYMKLTHCDLFFADAAVLVEGNVERLLLPLMIDKAARELKSSYLSILELGGAFAHVFKDLIQFLGLTTLIITDLDSVVPDQELQGSTTKTQDGAQTGKSIAGKLSTAEGRACMTDTPNAVTCNQTLLKWIPKLENIADLLAAPPKAKTPVPTGDEPAIVRVAYQTLEPAIWNGERVPMAGRTFEEAFAFQNLGWCQDDKQRPLGLLVTKNNLGSLHEVAEKIHRRVKGNGFNKTQFALALMMAETDDWLVPRYVVEGLEWLRTKLAATVIEPVIAAAQETGKS